MNHQDFWNDNELAQKVLQENKCLKETVEKKNQLIEVVEEIEVLIEIGIEESDGLIEKKYAKNKIHVLDDVKLAFPLFNRLAEKETYVLLENDLPDIFNEDKK